MQAGTSAICPLKIWLWLLLICASAAAQTTPGKPKEQRPAPVQSEVLRIETELVQIDLVVTDREGRLVGDLRREDFELYEDGKKQTISHFALGTAKQPARWISTGRKSASASDNTARRTGPVTNLIPTGRHIVLAVDDFHLAPENLLQAKRTLHKFLNEQMAPGDQIALATTSGTLGLFQQFTNDRDVLTRAINRLSVQTRTATNKYDSPRITDYQAELIDQGDINALELAVQEIIRVENPSATRGDGGGGNSGGGRGGRNNQPAQASTTSSGGYSPREIAQERARSLARMIVLQNAHYTQTTLKTLENLVRDLRALPGRKMLVLLSDGFYMGGAIATQVYDIRRITDAATRAGVVIYAIDARGLYAYVPGGDASQPNQAASTQLPGVEARIELSALQARMDAINALAADTGGFLFKNSNDLNLGLQRVLDDNETYYVLAYEPTASYRDGRFRKLEVRVANRSDLKVRTRKGYLSVDEKAEKEAAKVAEERRKEKSPEKLAQIEKLEVEQQVRAGLGSLLPLREVSTALAADFVNLAENGSYAMFNARIGADSLNFQQVNGVWQTTVNLIGVLFDESGKAAQNFSERLVLSLKPEAYETALKQGLNYRRLVPLKPGFYQARMLVREDKTARMGSAMSWVEIPDLSQKKLTLSGILLSAAGASPANAAEAADNSNYQIRPSSATRSFNRGSDIDFLLFTYNARTEKNPPDLVIQPQVFAGSKLVLASPLAKITPPTDADLQRIPYAARISTKGFEPGEYELRLVVIDRLTKATASQRVNFTVE